MVKQIGSMCLLFALKELGQRFWARGLQHIMLTTGPHTALSLSLSQIL